MFGMYFHTFVNGVPHGSTLGPILFIIYLTAVSRASDILFSTLFADDTTVLIDGHSYNNNTYLYSALFTLCFNVLL